MALELKPSKVGSMGRAGENGTWLQHPHIDVSGLNFSAETCGSSMLRLP